MILNCICVKNILNDFYLWNKQGVSVYAVIQRILNALQSLYIYHRYLIAIGSAHAKTHQTP